jgi:hypothetical protein
MEKDYIYCLTEDIMGIILIILKKKVINLNRLMEQFMKENLKYKS